MLTSLHEGAPGSSPVVVFPHAGGSPRFFRHWPQALSRTPLLGVTYPGRDTRMNETYADNPHGDDLLGLAHAAADAIRAIGLAAPVLVGHSFGAYLAYETATELLRRGDTGVRLVVSGQNPPAHRPATLLHRAGDDELVADIVRQNPGSAEVWANPQLRNIFLPPVREDYRLLETYAPPTTVFPKLPEILVCRADSDGEVLPETLDDWHACAHRVHPPAVFRGDHFYLAEPDLQLPRHLAATFSLR
ncbi:thioesterase [Amycolatopsis sp. A1MSW2902]|uniref:thioesterase II family protein n=1 Tax=Amycolatopsis sp. A1MSW2902 TaxID=687413 RepID=UPI00307E45E1